MKAYWLFTHPAPYKVKFFNELGQKIDLTVVFERSSESDRDKMFYSENSKTFKAITLKSLPFGHSNNYTSKAKKILKRENFDVIVINGWSSFTEMSVISFLKKKNIPYIFAINGGIPKEKENFFIKKLKTKYISGAAMYLAPDPRSASYLEKYGAPKDKIRFYPYSTVYERELLSAPLSRGDKLLLKRGLGIKEEKLFVSVGSFIERKNEMKLLEVWKTMPKDYSLFLIGSGPLENAYRNFVKNNSLSNVQILNFKKHSEVLRYLRLATASVYITKEDIYGHVLNESLSQGTPVIASRNSNSALHLINNGVNGFLVDGNNVDEIRKSLLENISDSMRMAAIETAKKNTIEKTAEAVFKALEEMTKR